jgi:carnitine 3-dehydrogenase
LIATAEQMYLHVDSAAAKASSADPAVRAKLQAIRDQHANLAPGPEAGRPVSQARA